MNPKISVVIPAFNEEKLIGRCLKALFDQDYSKTSYEVIVVDNRSTDKTAHICKQFGLSVLEYSKIQGIAAARHQGVSKAKGEIIAFTDADSIPAKDWLKTIDAEMSETSIVCVGGKALPDRNSLWNIFVFSLLDQFYKLNHFFGKPLLWGFNMAIKKYAYDDVGGVNVALKSAEDWDLALRLGKRFGKKSVKYIKHMNVMTSARKQDNLSVLPQYTIDGTINYINVVLRNKIKPIAAFNVR